MTTSVVIGRLAAIAVVIPGGDPLPRAGPGGLPHPYPRSERIPAADIAGMIAIESLPDPITALS
jgi:hypothetical protein